MFAMDSATSGFDLVSILLSLRGVALHHNLIDNPDEIDINAHIKQKIMNAKVSNDNNKSDDESSKPKNVPLRLWEKFKVLEKRTNETTKRSTEKRIKHLQKSAIENVARALHHPEDREIIRLPGTEDSMKQEEISSKVDAACPASRKRLSGHVDAAESEEKKARSSKQVISEEEEWRKVRGLLGVNDHLAGVSHGSLGPKTVLELKIESAIACGDLKSAEELSDHMASREFGEKVAKAIDAKTFLKHKQEEEQVAKEKQKKKLHWGFEAKHRWETKSNM